jgi:hypothetical protein
MASGGDPSSVRRRTELVPARTDNRGMVEDARNKGMRQQSIPFVSPVPASVARRGPMRAYMDELPASAAHIAGG